MLSSELQPPSIHAMTCIRTHLPYFSESKIRSLYCHPPPPHPPHTGGTSLYLFLCPLLLVISRHPTTNRVCVYPIPSPQLGPRLRLYGIRRSVTFYVHISGSHCAPFSLYLVCPIVFFFFPFLLFLIFFLYPPISSPTPFFFSPSCDSRYYRQYYFMHELVTKQSIKSKTMR